MRHKQENEMIGKWLKSGTKVTHNLNGWEGYVIDGDESRISNLGGTIALNEVRFFNPIKNELVTILVLDNEVTICRRMK